LKGIDRYGVTLVGGKKLSQCQPCCLCIYEDTWNIFFFIFF